MIIKTFHIVTIDISQTIDSTLNLNFYFPILRAFASAHAKVLVYFIIIGSKFVPTCHHCGVIGYIRPQCHKLKREENHVARSLPKNPSGPKHIACHYCGAFGHLRSHCSKFHALKRMKRKEKLELLGSCVNKKSKTT